MTRATQQLVVLTSSLRRGTTASGFDAGHWPSCTTVGAADRGVTSTSSESASGSRAASGPAGCQRSPAELRYRSVAPSRATTQPWPPGSRTAYGSTAPGSSAPASATASVPSAPFGPCTSPSTRVSPPSSDTPATPNVRPSGVRPVTIPIDAAFLRPPTSVRRSRASVRAAVFRAAVAPLRDLPGDAETGPPSHQPRRRDTDGRLAARPATTELNPVRRLPGDPHLRRVDVVRQVEHDGPVGEGDRGQLRRAPPSAT